MAELPPRGPTGRAPEDSRPPRLMLFDDEEGEKVRRRRRPPVLPILLLLVLGAAMVWGARIVLQDDRGSPSVVNRVTLPTTTRARSAGGEVEAAEVEATVASTVELSIEALDALGRPLPDTLLRLAVESGTGTLASDTARTDGEGTARVLVTLPPRPETMLISAEVVGTDLPPVRTRVIARPGPPRRIVKLQGDEQVTQPTGLVEGLAIRVLDEAGNPVPRVRVRFQPESEESLVAPSRPFTDSLGRAATAWRLGPDGGVQRLTVDVPGTEVRSVLFTATAVGAAGDAAAGGVPGAAPAPGADSEVGALPEAAAAPVVVVRRTFAVGGTFVCGLVSGRAVCRGANDRGQLGGGAGNGFAGLALGVSHACALDASGSASCWGANEGGQLGDGSRVDRSGPVPVDTEATFSVLTAGAGHTCGLAAGGRAFCWGRNLSGQLGDGTREDRLVPSPLPGNRAFQALVAGWEHTCGLGAGGTLTCWGSNAQGQLGNGSRTDAPSPTPVEGAFRSVVAGSRHTCAISGARVLCWGDNGFGQLGDGSTEARAVPTEVTGLPSAPTRLVAGAVHTCALLEDGSAWCWGQNVHGQLGDGTNRSRAVPAAVSGDLTFRSLFAGGALTCGFATEGGQYCWGLNQTGQLGDGTRDSRATPTRVGG